MKTTIELPDKLVKEIKLLAVHEGKKLKDLVADLLRQGLAATNSGATAANVDAATLKRRKALSRKFVSGEWGVELDGYEAARHRDRLKAAKRSGAWRE